MPIRAFFLNARGDMERDLDVPELEAALESKSGLLWVDVLDPTEGDGALLEQVFRFHHLAVEDCVSKRIHTPKVDDFGDHLFLVVHGVNHSEHGEVIENVELGVFLGRSFVVSSHNVPVASVDSIMRLVEVDGRPMRNGSDFLAYALIDALIDNVLPTINKMAETADELEEEALAGVQSSTPQGILRLKRSAQRLLRLLIPQGEVVLRVSRGDFPMVRREAQIYYRDIHDHIVRLQFLCQSVQERADVALTVFMSAVANRQNESIKLLTAVSLVFLPLMLVTGIYGMNFDNMPELRWRWGYFAALAAMVAIAALAVSWLWARKWYTWGRQQVSRAKPFAAERERIVEYMGELTKWPGQQE